MTAAVLGYSYSYATVLHLHLSILAVRWTCFARRTDGTGDEHGVVGHDQLSYN